jgi:hypothetical protein
VEADGVTFDPNLFDGSIFHAGSQQSAARNVAGSSKRRRKIQYRWKQQHKEYEEMIRRRK